MRQAFCNGLVQQAILPNFVFLTGDLGFKALEPLQDAMGARFINAGVSEQNMVSVAAGLARARPADAVLSEPATEEFPRQLVVLASGWAAMAGITIASASGSISMVVHCPSATA